MEENLPIYGVLALLLFKEMTAAVLRIVDAIKGHRGSPAEDETAKQIADLHAWHAHFDEDGVPTWQIPRSMVRAIEQQTAVLKDIHEDLIERGRVLEEIHGATVHRANGRAD